MILSTQMELYRPSLKNLFLIDVVHNGAQRWKFNFDIFGEKTIRVDCRFMYKHIVFLTDPSAIEWTIIPGNIDIISVDVLHMMELFFMDTQSIKKNPQLYYRGYDFTNYSMSYSFAENIFYSLIFRLATKNDTETVKKILFTYFEKYKMLIKTDYLLPELSIEISRYFIYFIFCNK